MWMRRVQGVLLGLLMGGCATEVDSPFTQVSAGGTEAVSTIGGDDASTTGGEPSTGASEGTVGSAGDSTGDPVTSAGTTDDPCTPDPCVAPQVCVDGVCVGVSTPGSGDVVITEVQPNPALVDDEVGEWFEVLNLSAVAVDLGGCELADQGTDTHMIAGSVVVESGAHAVLGRAAAANGGVVLDYSYGTDITLGNDGDELALRCGGVLVDEVIYSGTWPFDMGAAMQLDPSAGAVNDDVARWCIATTPYGDGDLGSPGQANPPC